MVLGGRARAILGAVAASIMGAALLWAGTGQGQAPARPVEPQPVVGVADSDTTLMGHGGGAPWAYRQLPLTVSSARAGGAQLEFGPQPSGGRAPQLAFLRHSGATGWQVAQTPLDEGGSPYRGMNPNAGSPRVTPGGGGVLVGRDEQRPPGRRAVALHRHPGGRFRVLPAPPPTVLLPGEELAEDQGAGRVAVGAFDQGGRTELLFGAVGPPQESAVVRWDGSAWSREPVEVPSGSAGDFRILALASAGPQDSWLLARMSEASGRGIALFERDTGGSGPRWVERPLGNPVFDNAATPSEDVEGVAALGGAAQPLTATADGAWVDGSLRRGGTERDFTLFYDQSADSQTREWCDASVCAAPLGVQLSRRVGYRSFAWPGSGFGTRIVTNPLDNRNDEATNRGTYLRFDGNRFARMPGAAGNFHRSAAFASADEGWLEGPVEVTGTSKPDRFRSWPVAMRTPLTDAAPQPGAPVADLGSQALAVGPEGGVARYQPGRGWVREFLFSSPGVVSRESLRGVAWPAPDRAHAVGDLGAMWQWNADTGLWEPDPGEPVGFEGNLMDVAFQAGDPERGFAVGKGGTLLSYGKSWEQQPLPGGYGSTDLTSVAFAGSQALVAAGRGLLVNDGGGWREDPGVRDLLSTLQGGDPSIVAVAGLPNGGAVAAGHEVVLLRDPGGAWRFSDQPLVGSTVVAAAAFQAGARTRAVVSVQPRLPYPVPDSFPAPDPNVPPPIVSPYPLPGDGYALRETAEGWIDEQRVAFSGASNDRPVKADPVAAFLLDGSGEGWAVGGWSGEADSAGRGSSARNSEGRANRARVRTAGIFRYGSGPAPPPSAGASPVPLPAGPVRLAVAGHAQCEQPCSDLAAQALAPDRQLGSAAAAVASLHGRPDGARALLYTGGRTATQSGRAEADRYAQLLGSAPGLPVYPAVSAGDLGAGGDHFKAAFQGFNAPFGEGAPPPGIEAEGIPGAAPAPGSARTHYAFDTTGSGGRVRVIVIDNSAGSLAASDPHQNPREPQLPWLQSVLADARARGIPAVVMGSRDLNTRFTPRLNVAGDGDAVARALVDGGASAYVFERPEETRSYRIPSGAAQTIPTFGSGTLGYRSPVSAPQGNQPDAAFGDSGFLLLELDAARRNGVTNQAPVSVRMIPLIEDLSLESTDGTTVRRSRVALFRGLGRRPRGGDRWGRVSGGDGNPDPPGGDPYTSFPPEQCVAAGCSTRVNPEYEFTSSDPDIADFVRQDPQSTNLRKPFLDANDKVVTDSSSSLLCAFNAGTTTVTVRAGGFLYREAVRVLPGSVLRPCGTRPLSPDRFRRSASPAPASPPPPPAPAGSPPVEFSPPPPPVVAAQAAPPPRPERPAPSRPEPLPPVPNPPVGLERVPVLVPPPPPPAVRPLPPGGAPARIYQVEREEEEEPAVEESQAFSRYRAEDHAPPPAFVVGLVVLAAFAGASVTRGIRGRGRRRVTPAPIRSDTNTRRSP